MKKTILFIALLVAQSTFAQKKEKVKGNKDIVEQTYALKEFNAIEVNGNFEIILSVNNSKNSYILKADSNIQDKIDFQITDSILKITSDFTLLPSKKMKIVLNTIQFNSIKLKNKSKVIQEGFAAISGNLVIETYGDSNLKMDVKSANVHLKMNNKSKCNLIAQTDSLSVSMDEKTSLESKINSNWMELRMYKNADAKIEGSNTELIATLVGKARVKAAQLLNTTAKVNQSLSSELYVNAAKKINIFLTDDSKIYLYNSPEVIVDGIRDFAQIIKKKL